MPNDIMPRNIRILREIPISQMTDEEIVKAAMDRLNTNSVMLAYLDEGRWNFIHWYRNGFFSHVKELIEHMDNWFGCKATKIGEEE